MIVHLPLYIILNLKWGQQSTWIFYSTDSTQNQQCSGWLYSSYPKEQHHQWPVDRVVVLPCTLRYHHTGPWQRTGAAGEGGTVHPDDTHGRALKSRWRTWSPWLLHCDEEAEREEQSSPTFDLQWHVSSVVYGYKWQRLFALFSLSPWWQLEHSVKMSASYLPNSSW